VGHLTSGFGFRVHPVFGVTEFHSGFDIANAKNTSIYATAFGTVKLCEWQAGYGRLIIIDHGHGLCSYFGHLEKILIKPGEHVTRGQLIGLMGSTGTSTGTHLHYEIRKNNQAISPAPYLRNQACQLPQASTLIGGLQ
jgi:murein DD-endopeptidase MepM/ murein hydrolase activator NlpD